MVSSILRDQSKENQLIVVRGGTGGGGFWRTWSSIDTVVSTLVAEPLGFAGPLVTGRVDSQSTILF